MREAFWCSSIKLQVFAVKIRINCRRNEQSKCGKSDSICRTSAWMTPTVGRARKIINPERWPGQPARTVRAVGKCAYWSSRNDSKESPIFRYP